MGLEADPDPDFNRDPKPENSLQEPVAMLKKSIGNFGLGYKNQGTL